MLLFCKGLKSVSVIWTYDGTKAHCYWFKRMFKIKGLKSVLAGSQSEYVSEATIVMIIFLLFFSFSTPDDSFSDYESDELEVLNPDTDSGVISPR